MSINSEYPTPEKQAPTTDQLIASLVDTFSYISRNVRDSEKFGQGLFELRNLDQQILSLNPVELAKMINSLQEKIGKFIGEEKVFINKNFQDLDKNTSREITSIPQQSQIEANKFPSSSDSRIALSENERHLAVAVKHATENTSNLIEDLRYNVSLKSEASLLTMGDYGAALGHLATLQQQRLETLIQPNP